MVNESIYLGKGKWGKLEEAVDYDCSLAELSARWKPNKPKLIEWKNVESYLKKGYIAEEKRDGARMALHITTKSVPSATMFNKYRVYDPMHKFPELNETISLMIEKMNKLKIKTITFDGELVVRGDYANQEVHRGLNRKDEFWRLNGRLHLENPLKIKMSQDFVSYVPFDILEKNGKSQMPIKLNEKRKLLESIESEFDGPTLLNFNIVNQYTDKKTITFDYAVRNNLEGFVLKRPDAPYTSQWYKVKAILDDTFKVTGLEYGESGVAILSLEGLPQSTTVAKGVDVGKVPYYRRTGWLKPEKVVGKKIIVSFMKGNTDKLRFPVINKVV